MTIILSSDVRAHEDANHDLVDAPYDADQGDREWLCRTCDRLVRVTGGNF